MQIRIEGRDLPGRHYDGDSPGYGNVHVGIQRRRTPAELLDLLPADAPSAVWTFNCAVGAGADVTGPYVQGRPGERFVYLSWGNVDDKGAFTMFRRAKLLFGDIDPEVWSAAEQSGQLIARLGLSDAKGQPLCARVRPPVVQWTAS